MDVLLQAQDLRLPPRLDGLSLSLRRGETLGLLGVNGAGKSSLLMALAGVLPGVRGGLRVAGRPLDREARRRIGWLPQRPPLYPDLSVRENLAFFAGLQGVREPARIDQALRRFDLDGLARRLVRQLSGGEHMRLALACVLAHEPDILLLDEPSAGLDPLQTEQLHHLIQRETPRRAVLLASHLLPDIERLCQRALLMHQGRVVATESLREAPRQVRLRLREDPGPDALSALPGIATAEPLGPGEWLLSLEDPAPPGLAEQIAQRRWGLEAWEPLGSGLMARFRALSTGESGTEAGP